MRILDRYLIRRFFHTYLICFFSLIGLYIVIDAFNNLDEFAEHTGGWAQTLQHMGGYYAFRTSLFFDELFGVITMMAAMFTLTWVRRGGELHPLLSAGIPIWRLVAPILIAALGVNGLAIANQELIIPGIRLELQREADDFAGTKSRSVEAAYDYQTNIFLDAKRAYIHQKQLEEVHLILPEELMGTLTTLEAREAFYRAAQGPEPAGWELIDTTPAEFAQLPEAAREVLKPLGPGRFFLVSNVAFEQLLRRHRGFAYASTAELVASLRNPSLGYGADQAVALHMRLLRPLSNLVLLLIGLPFVLGRERRNVFLSMGICLCVSAVFFAVTYACQHLGSLEYISPALAAWLPIVIFGSSLGALLDMVQT